MNIPQAKPAQLILGDCLKWLPKLPARSVDLVFADPPYYLQLNKDLYRPDDSQVQSMHEDWDQFTGFADYDAFTYEWLSLLRRVMKPRSALWISGTYHNIFRVGAMLQDMGYWIMNTITWRKINGMPNFRGSRFKNDVEFLIWAKYSNKSRYTFHHNLMKRFNDFGAGKQAGSVWQIHTCGGDERLKDRTGRKLHPAQKPEELVRRAILATSNPGDTILDPFMGTGTTIAVAKYLLRHSIGIESDPAYFKAAEKRIAKVDTIDPKHPDITDALRNTLPRVAFKTLIDKGYFHIGQKLYLDRPEVTAIILENGKLACLSNGMMDTIHGLGRRLKDAQSCNGWLHWYYEDEAGDRQQIDVRRAQYRADKADKEDV